jgi:hypothetical protein
MTNRPPRRKIDVRALRTECEALRYVAAFKPLSTFGDPELAEFARRTRKALGDLELIIYTHDDTALRMLLTAAGGAGAVYSIATMTGALGVVVALVGAGIALREAVKLSETIVLLELDQDMHATLSDFLDLLIAEGRRRGLSVPDQ